MKFSLYSRINNNKYINYTIILNSVLNSELDQIEYEIIVSLLEKEYGNTLLTEINPNFLYEIGPKKNFTTTFSSNIIEILKKININKVKSIEKSFIYYLQYESYDKMIYYDYKNTEFSCKSIETKNINIEQLHNCDPIEYEYYKKIFNTGILTNVELFDLEQSNSEHSRHWFFNGIYKIIQKYSFSMDYESLLDKIKTTNLGSNNSIIAFSDNSSSIKGIYGCHYYKNRYNKIFITKDKLYPTHTAETHNFPTCVSPFSGANTGVGGRIRDSISLGKGSSIISGYCGYCVGNIDDTDFKYPYLHPKNLLIEASNGASDYGNKIGEPITLGFTRSFGQYYEKRYEYVKPIMYCGGIGYVCHDNLYKKTAELGDLIVQVGGPAYKIGLGGGNASSQEQNDNTKIGDFDAVQRGDPFMANKLCRFVNICSNMKKANPLLSIHDQGSGGMGNVTKELIEPLGAYISLNNVNLGDTSMTSSEIWSSEYQEQCSFLTNAKHIQILKSIAKKENIPINFVGLVNNSQEIIVSNNNDPIYNPIFYKNLYTYNKPRKTYNLKIQTEIKDRCNHFNTNLYVSDFKSLVNQVLQDLDVGCKKFLTNKVDRSVTGLIAQQQCIGPYQLPLSNYSISKMLYYDLKGIATSIGERPYIGLVDVKAMVNMSLGEMLTNLIFVNVDNFINIKLLGNWMWSTNIKGNDYLLYIAVQELVKTLKTLNIGIDGGKDSLSMNIKYNDEQIISPNSLVLSNYVNVNDINCKLTPELKHENNILLFFPLSKKYRMGGSILLKILKSLDKESYTPNFEHISEFHKIFNSLQLCLQKNLFESGHDKSDGGLIVTLIEMCIASEFGCEINIKSKINIIDYMFNEELGLVYEAKFENIQLIKQITDGIIPFITIGKVTTSNKFKLIYNNKLILNENKDILLDHWMTKSYELELLQCNPICVNKEYKRNYYNNIPNYSYNYNDLKFIKHNKNPIVLVIREEGSNGDKELINCFYESNFDVYDVNMNDLLEDPKLLYLTNGIAFCGGFSYSDTLGSAVGWSTIINKNKKLKESFTIFYNRVNTFSIGICNGCQLMCKMNWVPNNNIMTNVSDRFESRYVNIKVRKSNCIFTQNMEGTIFGMWVAHKEGQITNDKNTVFSYCDNDGATTLNYPENPNGSINGCAGVCSSNGRHLALMPHPERSYYTWQVPWKPKEYNKYYTPWKDLFLNAYYWCK